MIVDDDPIIMVLLRGMLAPLKSELSFFDSLSCYNELGRLHANNLPFPDVIIMDVNMPELDGGDLYREIRQLHESHKTPILFISSNTEWMDVVKPFPGESMIGFLPKPLDTEAMIQSVKDLYARTQSHGSHSELRSEIGMPTILRKAA